MVWEGTRGHRRLSIELLNYLWRAQGSAASGIRLALDLEPVSLSVDTAVPCGLILNELASNALKHAFRGSMGGEVAVSLRGSPAGQVRLCVRDNGTGLPAGFDWKQARTLGLRLVQMLAGQLHAAVESKLLISGDALWEDDLPTITMRVEGSTCLFDLLDSLEKLESLDVEIMYL